MRRAALIFCLTIMACDPVQSYGIVLAPTPVLSDSVRRSVFTLAGLVARSHGLSSIPTTDPPQGWHECFGREGNTFSLCGRATDHEVQFHLFQALTAQLTPVADTVRRELTDSLRARFGVSTVRECRWSEHPDESRAGCPRW